MWTLPTWRLLSRMPRTRPVPTDFAVTSVLLGQPVLRQRFLGRRVRREVPGQPVRLGQSVLLLPFLGQPVHPGQSVHGVKSVLPLLFPGQPVRRETVER